MPHATAAIRRQDDVTASQPSASSGVRHAYNYANGISTTCGLLGHPTSDKCLRRGTLADRRRREHNSPIYEKRATIGTSCPRNLRLLVRASSITPGQSTGDARRAACRRLGRCGRHDAAQLAVEGLHATGLVHRLGEFVFATRPAVRSRARAAARRLVPIERLSPTGRDGFQSQVAEPGSCRSCRRCRWARATSSAIWVARIPSELLAFGPMRGLSRSSRAKPRARNARVSVRRHRGA